MSFLGLSSSFVSSLQALFTSRAGYVSLPQAPVDMANWLIHQHESVYRNLPETGLHRPELIVMFVRELLLLTYANNQPASSSVLYRCTQPISQAAKSCPKLRLSLTFRETCLACIQTFRSFWVKSWRIETFTMSVPLIPALFFLLVLRHLTQTHVQEKILSNTSWSLLIATCGGHRTAFTVNKHLDGTTSTRKCCGTSMCIVRYVSKYAVYWSVVLNTSLHSPDFDGYT